ncbi:methyltransferase domain-containing protein (plasmid) [Paenibacillus cellulosilyticus]|nr:methyltransferase domain-containing protein [Paenibacillus cellulosilyticus]
MDSVSKQRAHMPHGTCSIINRRTLVSSNKRLSELVRTGMAVLDVGCGGGAITIGIAEAVGPEGRVIGLDVNATLIEEAIKNSRDYQNLSFEVGDIYHLPYENQFDIVVASRVLQWLEHPEGALRSLLKAVKPGGKLLVLDYNHERLVWEPAPPTSMCYFYNQFLAWRKDAGMNNRIADELTDMMERNGLLDIRSLDQSEISVRTDDDFVKSAGIWADVAASRGHQMVADGWVTKEERAVGELEYRQWVNDVAERHVMYLLAVEGVKPV